MSLITLFFFSLEESIKTLVKLDYFAFLLKSISFFDLMLCSVKIGRV